VTADRRLYAVAALVFLVSAAVTVAWCGSMAAMSGMEMPGGWTMSMTWMRMPTQGWSGVAGNFLGMWTVMMLAMMLPVLAPQLRLVRGAVTMLKYGMAYFGVWIACGAALFPLGMAYNELAMRSEGLSRVTPLLAGTVVLVAAALQFTPWKTRLLTRCRHDESSCGARGTGKSVWGAGAQLGLRCVQCCAPLTVVLLVCGVMDLRVMALVTVAISAERLISSRLAYVVGACMVVAGGFWIVQFSAAVLTVAGR
jgi:predicted metal-binding membrane protein